MSPIKIYTVRLTRKNLFSDAETEQWLANVLLYNQVSKVTGLLEQKVLLMSPAVAEGGKIVIHTQPTNFTAVDTGEYRVDVLSETDFHGQVFNDLNEMIQVYTRGRHLVVEIPNTQITNRYYLFEQVPPPKGVLECAGNITTANGEKQVRKYSHAKQLNILDTVTGASVDIEPEDLAAYYTQ